MIAHFNNSLVSSHDNHYELIRSHNSIEVCHKSYDQHSINTIALVDFYSLGHHSSYLRLYSQILLELGYRVIVFSPIDQDLSSWQKECFPQFGQVFFSFFLHPPSAPSVRIPKLNNFLNRLNIWRHVGKALKNAEKRTKQTINLVFFLWLDEFIMPVPWGMERVISLFFPYR